DGHGVESRAIDLINLLRRVEQDAGLGIAEIDVVERVIVVPFARPIVDVDAAQETAGPPLVAAAADDRNVIERVEDAEVVGIGGDGNGRHVDIAALGDAAIADLDLASPGIDHRNASRARLQRRAMAVEYLIVGKREAACEHIRAAARQIDLATRSGRNGGRECCRVVGGAVSLCSEILHAYGVAQLTCYSTR